MHTCNMYVLNIYVLIHVLYAGGKAYGQLKDEQMKSLGEINEVYMYMHTYTHTYTHTIYMHAYTCTCICAHSHNMQTE